MNIIPVIDLLGSVVVRGIAGRRSEYRPLVSRLAADATPANVGAGLAACGFRAAYVADLDAILHGQPNWPAYTALAAAGLELWIDAGLTDAERAAELATAQIAERPIAGIVVGLETLISPAALAEILRVVGAERVIFSLDLAAGRPLACAAAWQDAGPLAIAEEVLTLGVKRIIVLDLARVGVAQGCGTEELCRAIRSLSSDVELIAGGGVRHADDIAALAAAGCDGVLVASALHDGRVAIPTAASGRAIAPPVPSPSGSGLGLRFRRIVSRFRGVEHFGLVNSFWQVWVVARCESGSLK